MPLKRLPSSGWKGLQSWSKIYQLRQDPIADLSYRVGMPPFIYRCPNTGMNVQGWVADDPTEGDGEIYYSITCTICTRLHLVDPKTGKVLGADLD